MQMLIIALVITSHLLVACTASHPLSLHERMARGNYLRTNHSALMERARQISHEVINSGPLPYTLNWLSGHEVEGSSFVSRNYEFIMEVDSFLEDDCGSGSGWGVFRFSFTCATAATSCPSGSGYLYPASGTGPAYQFFAGLCAILTDKNGIPNGLVVETWNDAGCTSPLQLYGNQTNPSIWRIDGLDVCETDANPGGVGGYHAYTAYIISSSPHVQPFFGIILLLGFVFLQLASLIV